MLIRTFKGVVHIMAGLLAGTAIVLLTLAWLLSRGPISLGFLAPYVGDLINDALPTVEAEFDDTILAWAGWERAVDLRVINLRVRADGGAVLVQVPEVAFSISTKALTRGIIAPAKVELFGPTLYAIRETDGRLNLALAGAGAVASGRLEPFLAQLTKASDPDDPLSYLEQIDITDADLIIEDTGRGRSWVTPDTQISLRRDGARIDGETSFLIDLDGTVAEVSLVGTYDASTRRIDAGLSFDGVTPSVLADSAPEVDFLKSIDVPVHGTITIASSVDGVLESVGFDVTGDDGILHLPAPLGTNLQTESFSLRGHFDASRRQLKIAEFRATFPSETTLLLPPPVDHRFPLSGIAAAGTYDGENDSLALEMLELNLSGITASASGTIGQLTSAPQVALMVDIPELTIAQSKDYWPRSLGTDAYDWVGSQVLAGVVSQLHLNLEGKATADGEFSLDKIDGGFEVSDATVRYADALPTISIADASAKFNKDEMEFKVGQANSFGMNLGSGNIFLSGLSGDTEQARITTVVSGGFQKAMELMDREPLNFAEALDISPANATGTVRANLTFDFPLEETLKWSGIKASATAELDSVSIPQGLFGLDVEEGQLELSIDNNGMSVTGELLLQNFPTILTWRQNFNESAPFKNRYEISTHVTDVQNIADLGFDVSPFSSDMIKGEVPVNVHVVETHDGNTELEARASLDGVLMSIPVINWRKEAGTPGEAQVSVRLQNNEVIGIPKFAIHTEDLAVEGAAYYAPENGTLNRIELSRITYGRTDMSGLLVPGKGDSWDANFTGPSLDLAPVWDDIVYGDFTNSDQTFLTDVSVSGQFDRVWLSDERALDNLVAAFARENEVWRTVYITSQVENGALLEIKMTPSEQSDGRIVTVWSSDAGEVLRTFDLYDLMAGGELSLTGIVDDTQENSPFSGLLEIQRYRIVEAPTLARLVSLMALTGILEALQGDGLAFEVLKIPFDFADGVIHLTDARATGASLGFTASGSIYTHADVVDIEGTVIPVYALNSVLGKLPLIGNIFSGGEEGGGIFAANYTMTGLRSDPDVSVNPLSALAPGFLRNFFGIFDDAGGPPLESGNSDSSPIPGG